MPRPDNGDLCDIDPHTHTHSLTPAHSLIDAHSLTHAHSLIDAHTLTRVS